MSKENLLQTLHQWIDQKPGLDPRNYIRDWQDKDGIRAYKSEARSITADLHDARALLRAIEWRAITPQQILDAARHAYSGRLEITQSGETYSINYCTGQYWPTEYRRAVCAVLSSALWDYFRDSVVNLPEPKGVTLRQYIKKELGARMQRRWFN